MTKEEKSKIKYRMKCLARKFCKRNDVYKSFDSSVGKLIEKAYFSAYLLCLHENKNKIADLEKENAEWKQRNETLKDALEHARKVYGDDLEKSYKEIAELKKQQFTLKNERNTFLAQNEQYEKDLIGFNDQLTKAKELLKKVIKVTWGEGWNYSLDVKVEAEQFISDIKEG